VALLPRLTSNVPSERKVMFSVAAPPHANAPPIPRVLAR
jgi:hypothetical protein